MKKLFGLVLIFVCSPIFAQVPNPVVTLKFANGTWEDNSQLGTLDFRVINNLTSMGCKDGKWTLKNIHGIEIGKGKIENNKIQVLVVSEENLEEPITLTCECTAPQTGKKEFEIIKQKPVETSGENCSCDFIPKQILTSKSGDKASSAIEGKIVLDVAAMQIIYPKKKKGSFSPKVDQQLGVALTNYNAYRDSIAVSVDFLDRNTEYGERFLGFINARLDTTGATAKKAAGDQAQAGEKQGKVCLSRLASDLERYYLSQSVKASKKIEDIEIEIAGIESQIISCFNLPGFDLLTELKPAAHSDEMKDYQKVVKYLKLIKGYQINSFLPFQVKNMDVTQVTFHAFRKGSSIGSSTFEFLNAGGFKIDFSMGLVATGLIDHKYIAQTVSVVDTTYKIDVDRKRVIDTLTIVNKNKVLRSDEGNFSIGIGLLSHTYFRTGKRINIGLTSGFTINNNAATNYLLGGSLLLGSEKRMVLSGGWAWGKVKRLENSLTEGQIIPIVSGQTTNGIVTKDQWNRAWFFGISYNLGGATIGGR